MKVVSTDLRGLLRVLDVNVDPGEIGPVRSAMSM